MINRGITMKKLLTLFVFIVLSFGAQADPADYPPTAFQLAQICHYVMKTDEVYPHVSHMKTASSARSTFEPSEYYEKPALKFLSKAEVLIKRFIKKPEDMTKVKWSEFVNGIVNHLKRGGEDDTLAASFLLPGCKEIILKAIMAEQEAMQNDEVVLWRGCEETAEIKKTQTEETQSYFADDSIKVSYRTVPKYTSFSLGLFSGFLFDGHKYHKLSSRTSTGACTYTYFSAFLYHKRMVEAGPAGFYAKMRKDLCEFFNAHPDYPEVLGQDHDAQKVFEQAVDWYNHQYKGDRWKDYTLYNRFNAMKMLIWSFGHDLQTLPNFHLFGVTMSKAELEREREAARQAEYRHVANSGDERGEFFQSKYAVYGRGETFHPKLVFPQEGRLIKLYTYPSVEVVDDNDDD